MSSSRLVAAAIIALAGSAQTGIAQSRAGNAPAEFPPASFAGSQYVDSRGCAFIRAGISGTVTWVPRMSRDREPLCGFAPTAVAAPPRPVIPDVPAATTTVAAPTVTPPPRTTRAPMNTVATITTPPVLQPARPVAPAVTTPVVAAPAPVAPPVALPVAAPEPRRISLAEACAGKTGPQPGFVLSTTGETLDCGPGAAVVVAAAPAPAPIAAPQPVVAYNLCGPADTPGQRYLTGGTGVPVRCGPQTQSPSGVVAGGFAGYQSDAARFAQTGLLPQQQAVIAPPPGYREVWTDGRLNPQRGLPQQVAQAPGAPVVTGDRVSTRVAAPVAPVAPAPQMSGTGHRYVQVGTFADPANADRTAARLQAMGLPVGFGNVSRGGTQLRVVAAGPFGDAAALAAALRAVRGAGFGDAFTRQ